MLFVFVWTVNILKTELFENDDTCTFGVRGGVECACYGCFFYKNAAGFHSALFVCLFVFTSVRLISRTRQNLSTVLPPPPISPLNMLKDVAYNREFNMMYLLIDEQEIWIYYTRYNLSNAPRPYPPRA